MAGRFFFWVWVVCMPVWGISQQAFYTTRTPDGLVILAPNGQEILRLRGNEGFLVAGEVRTKSKDKMASFTFKDKFRHRYTSSAPLQFKADEEHIILVGEWLEKRDTVPYLWRLEVRNSDAGYVFSVQTNANHLNYLQLNLQKGTGPFFGLGEQFSHVNLDDYKVPVFSEEQGIGRGDKHTTGWANLVGAGGNEWTTYLSIPFCLLGLYEGLMLENFERSEFDFTDVRKVGIGVHATFMRGRIFHGDHPKEVLRQFTSLAGRQAGLPDWAYGTWLGIQGGATKVDSLANLLRKEGTPLDAIWIQDWVGKRKTSIGSRLWWNWEPDSTSYPGFRDWVQAQNAKGTQVLGYINPFLAPEGNQGKIAVEKDYVVHDADGAPYLLPVGGFKAYILDLSNEDARSWMKSIIQKNMIGNGLSGWMADFGEWLPMDAILANGSPEEWHNRYPLEWAKLNREAIIEAGREGEIVFFSRSGYLGSAKYSPLFWAGDQTPDFGEHDGMPSAVRALLSSGLSGLQINHADAGGYTNLHLPMAKVHRDREVYDRWLEFAAFTPVFRTHEGLQPQRNVQPWSDEAARASYARAAKWHGALAPYFEVLSLEAAESGLPFVRHLALEYPEDTATWTLDRQYLLGADLLVLPVLERGTATVSGYFPAGKWRHALSGQVLEGGTWHEVPAPIGTPAVYVREGGKSQDLLLNQFERLD